MNKEQISKLAPTAFINKSDYYIMGDRYVCNLLVTQLPREFSLGLLREYTNHPKVKLFMKTEKMNMNISQLLRKDYKEKEAEWNKTTDPSLRHRLEDELMSLNNYIEENIRNNDATLNVVIVFSIHEDNEKALKELTKDIQIRLNTYGFRVAKLIGLQETLLRMSTPWWLDTKVDSTIEYHIGVPLPAMGVAGFYPYVFDTVKDAKGFLFGRELYNSGIILWDPFFYLNNKAEAARSQRLNGNILLLGKSGSGKTTAGNLIIRNEIKNDTKIIWWDPENKNEKMTSLYDGTFIEYGKRGCCINPFDLKPIDSDEEDNIDMWDTELAIFNVTEDIKILFKYLFPETDFKTLSIVGDIVIRTFEKVGITKDKRNQYPNFQSLERHDMPTFHEFNLAIEGRIQELQSQTGYDMELNYLNELHINMKSILNEWSVYFNGHTNIQKDNQILSFGMKKVYQMSDNLKRGLKHIAYGYAWSLCLSDERSLFVIDEASTELEDTYSARRISQNYRRGRKYNNITMLMDQEPKGFTAKDIEVEGKAIFNNSVYKLFMLVDLDSALEISKLYKLNENELELLQTLNQGEALFVCGDKKIPIQVLATSEELNEMA